MRYTDDYVWPQELAFWKTYVGQDAGGYGTVIISPGELTSQSDIRYRNVLTRSYRQRFGCLRRFHPRLA